jgi:alginate O-acetyltransferase complex protein AlgI
MLFNSYSFLLFFLPLTLSAYHSLPGPRSRLALLVFSSWLFYAWWSLSLSTMVLAFCAVNFWVGGIIHRSSSPGRRRAWIVSLVGLDLGVLAFFKYHPLLAQSLAMVHVSVPEMDIVLPIGISFYTFQGVSYAVDLYRRKIQPAPNLVRYTCFKLFFPQLIAGPIVRYDQIGSQLGALRSDYGLFAKGIFFFASGLAKKVLLADTLAGIADDAFAGGYSGMDAYLGLVAFSFQIYFDFSAYSDMAYGLGHMFGIKLPQNFNSPYKSPCLTEFWKRWHITLSQWLRDYLYIPLGGNRKGKSRMYLALIITMLLGGLWHGASYTFILWGLMHGALLVLEKSLGSRNPLLRLPSWVQVAVTFHLVMAAWVFFRCPSLAEAVQYFSGLSTWTSLAPMQLGGRDLLKILLCVPLVWISPNLYQLRFRLAWPQVTWSLACLILGLAVLGGKQPAPFLYFQF